MDATPLKPCRTAADFGDLIRNARRGKGLTQQALADRIGTARTTIIRWEGGNTVLAPKKFRAACRELGIDPRGGVVALGYLTADELGQAA